MLLFTHKLARLLFLWFKYNDPSGSIGWNSHCDVWIFAGDYWYGLYGIFINVLLLFYKMLSGEKNYSHIFFIITSLIAMLIKGPVFLIIVGVALIFKLADLNISMKKKIIQLSNLSIVIFISIFLALLYNILTEGQFFQQSLIKDFGGKLIETQESHGGIFGYYLLGSFLIVFPIYPLLIIGIFYNFFK